MVEERRSESGRKRERERKAKNRFRRSKRNQEEAL